MSVSHGYSTMGGIEYNDGGYVEKTKRRKSHIDAANQWAREMPILMSMQGVGIVMQWMH